jgi:hypothetical protein
MAKLLFLYFEKKNKKNYFFPQNEKITIIPWGPILHYFWKNEYTQDSLNPGETYDNRAISLLLM